MTTATKTYYIIRAHPKRTTSTAKIEIENRMNANTYDDAKTATSKSIKRNTHKSPLFRFLRPLSLSISLSLSSRAAERVNMPENPSHKRTGEWSIDLNNVVLSQHDDVPHVLLPTDSNTHKNTRTHKTNREIYNIM